MVPFSFPLSKCALWDPVPMGDVIGSHITYYRNPKLSMVEKTLRLAYRHAKQSEKKLFSCFLLGTLAVDEDGEGITLTIDRFDPGREVAGGSGKIPTASLPGDFLIPCTVNAWGLSSDSIIVHSAEDISLAFKGLQHSLCSKESLDLSKLLSVRAHIIFTENLDNLHFNFHWASITAANILEYTPVKSVPIIPTALARNLNSPMNIAQVQGTYKCGYLTMDQTRKLLLLLESDPKAYALPLVGVWLSGVTHICSPQVWACCLRYLFSSSIQERVFSESQSFLIVLYSLTHKEPEFYECVPCSGQTELGFQILTCNETVHLFKNVEPSGKSPIQFELSAENQNAETEFFSRVCKKLPIRSPSQGCSPSKLSASDHDSGVEDEDLSPRPIPSPHPASQQVTRIFPSVPELSLVLDGSFIESGQSSKPVGTSNAKSLPSAPHQPIKKKWCLGSTYYPTQHSEDKQNLSANMGDPSLRQLPNHLNQKILTSRPSRGKQALLQQQLHCKKACPQSRKSSGSSSSSTPCSGPSPDTSVHHPRKPSERLVLNPDGVAQQGEPPIRRTSISCAKQLPAVKQPVLYNSAFSPQSCRRPPELQVPVQVPPCCPASACNCQFPASIQYNPINSWQGIGRMSPKHGAEIQSEMAQQNPCTVLHQNIICPNICCNPGYTTSSPISMGYHGKMGNCSLDNSLSPGIRLPSSASPSSPQFCAAHSPCLHMLASKAGSDNGMMGLSPDAYRVLTEQDRQLKLLQAQIQRLLEAQARQACSSEPAAAGHAPQPEKQGDLVSMETQSSPGSPMRKSVSIAVSTGASLFWNTASEKQDDSIPQGKKEDEEISKEEINISINAEQDASNTSIASSLKVVDMPSFVDSIHLVEEGTNQNTLQSGNVSQALVHSSSLEESISVSLQKEPTEGASNHLVVTREPNSGPPASLLPRHPSEDQKLYQDLLGQVNHLLRSSEEQDHLSVKSGFVNDDGPKYQDIDNKTEMASETDTGVVDKESVISATLKQLKSLGVTIDSPGKMKTNTRKVENASILACINPEAVVPGLNYMSFANVSMCGLTPNVVDLSMEANAIALKYLSENQLSRLSFSRSGQNPPVDFSFQDILHTNMDKSMVGFSLISPNNMSFATKKYMKRYGLIQSTDSSEDEEELQVQDGNSGTVKSMLDKHCIPVLDGFNHQTELSKRTDGRLPIHLKSHSRELTTNASPPELNSPVLRNITNEIFPPRADQADENSVQILKDLKSKPKLLPGRVEFTEQPGRKDEGDIQVFPGNLHTPALETLNQSNSINSVGTILDVKQLRQLPKLF
ncbi:SCL-interrupting locus protein isoform X1 [Aquila chrysaetos chrysaetos]|uniref:SCL-interrupting locus protein isoform X1 n=2 Tax=Aquila chrysaetos chrysaetos TaxID=223781 RepID=UPI001176CFAD|nr:SCL-interrupting locus protein isoform X1 [Aquila chrysaetos chrysaetos]XP_029888631.1 SCL-interrupting locus protein isoform X1 [Aquila chrysaetos chrysaetos]XP_040983536.1 SCL-interrupting locus protein isoform X1 [Aquila chrysaetos chrysaetos]XP_040983537.1 SCL-interrupting locus protein isoform X1 [Aquila chrysaetos chrysaetos]